MYTINPNLRIYTNQRQMYVVDASTGTTYKASFAYTTPYVASIGKAYSDVGMYLGYLANEYNVYRIEETGEEFVYPFSYGWADPVKMRESAMRWYEEIKATSEIEADEEDTIQHVGVNDQTRFYVLHAATSIAQEFGTPDLTSEDIERIAIEQAMLSYDAAEYAPGVIVDDDLLEMLRARFVAVLKERCES